MLFYGIIGALLFRAIFIALGSFLMQYRLVVAIFGVFLILTGLKMLRAPDQKVDPEQEPAGPAVPPPDAGDAATCTARTSS